MPKIFEITKRDCNQLKFSKHSARIIQAKTSTTTTTRTTTTNTAATTTSKSIKHKMQSRKNFFNFQIARNSSASPTTWTILATLLAVMGLWAQTAVSSPVQLVQQQQQQEHQQQLRKSAATFSASVPASVSASSTSSGSVSLSAAGAGAGAVAPTKTTTIAKATSSIRVHQCREGCLEKFSTKEDICQQNSECLTCWDECAKPPPPKLIKTIRETWSLHTVSMLQQDSLVLVDVAWEPLTMPTQCLVTWEVAGGGLMGNLLTESFNVQLSLWPETKYRVQVTCKNKLTGTMTRSMPLSIDTAEAIISADINEKRIPVTSQKSMLTTLQSTGEGAKYEMKTGSSSSANMMQIDENSLSIDSAAVNSADVEDTASVLPYEDDEDHSSETLNQHTNFVFNWHTKNSGLSTVDNLQKPDMNLLTIQILSNMQKPLLFGVAAGTMLMAMVLLLYICLMRQQRALNDKTALMKDAEAQAVDATMPAAMAAAAAAAAAARSEENCQHAANCSRYALKV